jgi:hypothetical protein
VHEFHLLGRSSFKPILPSAKANLCELVQFCLEFLTINVSLVCHELFPKRQSRLQMTDSCNATIDQAIPLLWASSFIVDDAHGLVNVPDVLPHFIIYPLCCQATFILPNPHGLRCP